MSAFHSSQLPSHQSRSGLFFLVAILAEIEKEPAVDLQ
jgi:hypothetical protein